MRIDDLRTTLAEHADLTHDEGLADRAGAVRGRVRAVRRRRAAVAVACVAGAVLAVPTVRALDTSPPEPATDRDLAGRCPVAKVQAAATGRRVLSGTDAFRRPAGRLERFHQGSLPGFRHSDRRL